MEDDKKEVIISDNEVGQSVDAFSKGLQRYLENLGLPTKKVLVNPEERMDVLDNVPRVVHKINPELRNASMYISKFIAACGAGLFDAALNFLWNETVMNLRSKVVRFDMDYFLNSIISDPRRRASFKTEEDLKKLDEWELIKGCKDTGIITEIGYKHLDYIRDMRNYASAAHPNQNDLDGLQLTSWLQTCIKEVLAKEPQGPVLDVKRLLNNLRKNVLSSGDLPSIKANIEKLPVELVDSTIRAVFGMYTDPQLDVQIRNNLKLIAAPLWNNCSIESKRNLGVKYAIYSANADTPRKELAREFLQFVHGLSYLPKEQIAADLDTVLDNLFMAHNGFNNFYNEPPHAKLLSAYIPNTGDIPLSIVGKYVKILVMCSIGNGYGVSGGASIYYDNLINRFNEVQMTEFVGLLNDSDVRSRLQFPSCAERFKDLIKKFIPRVADVKLQQILRYLDKTTNNNLQNLNKASEYKRLIQSIQQ
ncbi:hypothetical protein NIE88_21650 [Sporolactobacillus shoreicorticis]|uniref:Uncharacterized protein n=1 Tax=Sporolactobacillus shoreicorticis TaxID=1923877 RepID=A0ABW5RZ74_9BACL|nr:hypothetical protein [Sporolactobacillus shoreicorticis]MCO7128334.1 hypothetical protein [Sporolactobacillus shoreicorticis]